MSEYRFYGSMEDRGKILEGLFSLGFRVIPNLNYQDHTPTEFRDMNAGLAQAMSVNKLLYVSGPFTKHPPALSLIESGPFKGTHVIEATLKRGGPILSLSLPSCTTERGRIKLGPGSLFHPREYWIEDGTKLVPPSQELREGYRRLKKVIAGQTLARKVSVSIRIGCDALRLFEEGVADILVDGKWLSRNERVRATRQGRPATGA